MSKILTFTPFLAKTLVEKSSSLAKYHRRDILYISKTFSELRGICEKKVTIIRHIEVNILKQTLKKTLKIVVQTDSEDVENSDLYSFFGENSC